MKNNRLKIYLVVALFLVMGVGYAFLNQDVELDNSVTVKGYDKPGVPAPTPTNITIVIGSILFFISDMMLMFNKFGNIPGLF